MNVVLFGAEADGLRAEIEKHSQLTVVDQNPDVVICFGGDGTLLAAELRWPSVPKAPIRNSRRGFRCIPHPPARVIERLASDALVTNHFTKLECSVLCGGNPEPVFHISALNEINVHMGNINSAVRFKLWLDDQPYMDGLTILGDGFVVSTPFGSTAYFSQITRGLFHSGIGIAFKATAEHVDHLVTPDTTVIRTAITRGPAVLAYDNAPDYFNLDRGDELIIRKHPLHATLLTWDKIRHPWDIF